MKKYKYISDKYGNPGVEIVGSYDEIVSAIRESYPDAEFYKTNAVIFGNDGVGGLASVIADQDDDIVAVEIML